MGLDSLNFSSDHNYYILVCFPIAIFKLEFGSSIVDVYLCYVWFLEKFERKKIERKGRWCLFFHLILNRTLMLNIIKYYVVCFCSILFLLNIKKKVRKN